MVSHIHFNVPLVKSNELKSILKSLDPSKSTGIDGISPKMLKLASDVLLSSLLRMINISLQSGIFPNVLKEARVFPIHKGGPSEDPSNYKEFCEFLLMTKTPNRGTSHKHTNNNKQENILRKVAWDMTMSVNLFSGYSCILGKQCRFRSLVFLCLV